MIKKSVNTTIEEKVAYFFNDGKNLDWSDETCREYAAVVREFLTINENPEIHYDASYTDHKKHMMRFREHLLDQDLSYSRTKYKITAVTNWYNLLLDDG
ncbi:hypothetical protein MsAg5_12970 [Methanosarcinaceae archaeon Ag5]|uniref:Core-binding (CB) domain-containing protein n=1 Tax=Methanolapillus africanus TaxID=3028297 RepID=A0AAE4MKT4_9EURY|nr:hypothetical protein [Methanosarcinaceae archaeon Ag5]